MIIMDKKRCNEQVRRIAIDILQCGNYIERGNNAKARYNISEVISALNVLLVEMEE